MVKFHVLMSVVLVLSAVVQNIFLETGVSEYAQPSERISDAMFGARYTGHQDLDRFLSQTDDLGLGLIVWPGGTLAETRDDLFDLRADGLWIGDEGRPGLGEMIEVANAAGAGLSIIVPTLRYVGREAEFASDLRAFAADLFGGAYGALPEPLILEIGSEYFAHFEDDGASAYGALADIAVRELTLAMTNAEVNPAGVELTIAVQAGKTLADDEAIRGELSDLALENVDSVIHHRFAYQPQGIDARLDELDAILDGWTEARDGATPDLFVSAYNTVTLVRSEILSEYLADSGVDAADVDLLARSHVGFESYWQDKLESASYGQEHAAFLLEAFASYAEAGMDAGAAFGIDWVHPGRLSWRAGGEDHDLIGAEMLEMLHESVDGTFVHRSDGPYDRDGDLHRYVFENDDKLIVFLAAGRTAPGDIALEVDGLGTELRSVTAERLVAEVPGDWMTRFGVPNIAGVDESPEGETYAMGTRQAARVTQEDDALILRLEGPHDVVRLSFAKTAAGAAEIAGFAEAPRLDLDDPHAVQPEPARPPEEEEEAGGVLSDMEMMAEAASGGMSAIFLLALVLFL